MSFALSATHKEHLRGVFFLFLKAYSFWFDK